jgi:hypothetical protein
LVVTRTWVVCSAAGLAAQRGSEASSRLASKPILVGDWMSIDPPFGERVNPGTAAGGKFYSSSRGDGALLRFVTFP